MSTVIQYEYFKLYDGRVRKLLPSTKFDRKTFNPLNDATDKALLKAMRMPGRSRYSYLRHGNVYPSPSLRQLLPAMEAGENKGESYIDFACGESADRFIAQRLGYQSSGMDLFPPVCGEQNTERLIIGDIAEPLPFPDYTFTYATCHAAVSLLKPSEREGFYREAYRCMKVGGMFVLNGVDLKNGYGFNLRTERERLLNSTKFDFARGFGYGVVVERNW